MLKRLFDGVMERRARRLLELVRPWLPASGPVLDLGSGTGHFSALLRRQGLAVVAADVTDLHVVGPAPVLVGDGALPFDDGTFSAALLPFMLAYPEDPAAVLTEAARVTRGPVIVVQTLYSGPFGYAWHRARELLWTVVAFHVSRRIGYVPRDAAFTMHTRRFFTAPELARVAGAAGLRVRARRERSVLLVRALVTAAWVLERDFQASADAAVRGRPHGRRDRREIRDV